MKKVSLCMHEDRKWKLLFVQRGHCSLMTKLKSKKKEINQFSLTNNHQGLRDVYNRVEK